jgi:hypothetical protein
MSKVGKCFLKCSGYFLTLTVKASAANSRTRPVGIETEVVRDEFWQDPTKKIGMVFAAKLKQICCQKKSYI